MKLVLVAVVKRLEVGEASEELDWLLGMLESSSWCTALSVGCQVMSMLINPLCSRIHSGPKDSPDGQ